MFDQTALIPFDNLETALGRALWACEEYCVAVCCGMKAYNITIENMRRWSVGAPASDIEQARREIEAAIEALASAPERFYFLDCGHPRSEVREWFESIQAVLAELRATGPIPPEG